MSEKIIVNLETITNEIVKHNAMHVSEFLNVMMYNCPILYLARECPKNAQHNCYMCWVEYLLLQDKEIEEILEVLK